MPVEPLGGPRQDFSQIRLYSERATETARSGHVASKMSRGSGMPAELVTRAHRGGAPLDPTLRSQLEPALGTRLDKVRVHTDADDAARALDARAFAFGEHVFFRRGAYDPHQRDGKRLIAHEVAHTVQTRGAAAPTGGAMPVSQPGDASEREADAFASAFADLSPHDGTVPARAGRGPLPDVLDDDRAASDASSGVSQQRAAGAELRRSPVAIGGTPLRLARQKDGSAATGNAVSSVDIFLANLKIDFHTAQGMRRYTIEQSGLKAGDYTAAVTVTGNDVDFRLTDFSGNFEFSYKIDPGQPNPSTFFAKQTSVPFHVHDEAAPPIEKQPAASAPDPNATYLTPEEIQKRCESGDLKVKTFPFRGTRFGAAPIEASRDGDKIRVKLPVYVLSNDDFRAQTRTLPTEAFIGGVKLDPNEIVRVHVYEPHWYHLNITGDASGDEQREFCVTGEQMLAIGEASTNATLFNIGLTVVDAATLFIPAGKIAGVVAKPLARGATTLTAAAMIGTAEAAPTALGGIASRAATTVIEEQVVTKVGTQALKTTVSQTVVKASAEAAAEAAPKAVGQVAAPVVTGGLGNTAVAVVGAGAKTGAAELAGAAVKPGAPSPPTTAPPTTAPPTTAPPTTAPPTTAPPTTAPPTTAPPTTAPPTTAPPTTAPPTTAPPTTAPPVSPAVSAATPTVTTNVIRPVTTAVSAAETAEIQRVEGELASIVQQAVQDVSAGKLGTGPAAARLASTPATDPLYRARLGNAIQEVAADAIDAARTSGKLPANLVFNRGRALPGGGRFSPLRPDLRLPLGAGREAVWDITTRGQAGHVDPKYLKGFVAYLAELLY